MKQSTSEKILSSCTLALVLSSEPRRSLPKSAFAELVVSFSLICSNGRNLTILQSKATSTSYIRFCHRSDPPDPPSPPLVTLGAPPHPPRRRLLRLTAINGSRAHGIDRASLDDSVGDACLDLRQAGHV